jgi:7-keto-8-aminopelargonate synthetase-like enzyme
MTLSRAKIKWFKHNDVEDLERILDEGTPVCLCLCVYVCVCVCVMDSSM